MPFKSEAQRKKFLQLVKEGKMKQSVYDEWARETGSATLPERASRSKKPRVRQYVGRKY